MGDLYFGNNTVNKIYWGATEVIKIYYGDTEIYSAEEQLAAPTLSLEGDTLTITDNSEMAESFDIYVDGVLEANVPTTSGYTVTFTVTDSLEETPLGSGADIYINQTAEPDYTIVNGILPDGSPLVVNGVESIRIEVFNDYIIVNGTTVQENNYIDITPTQDMQVEILTCVSET